MAVSIILSPDTLALTKGGRMRYQFQGSGRYQTLGSQAINILRFNTALVEGTTLTLRWNSQTVTIVAKNNPEAANEFPAGDGSWEYTTDVLLPFFQQFFPFREDFTAQASQISGFRRIALTAKQPGPQYNIKASPVGGTSPWVYELPLGGSNALIRDRYSVYVELWLQKPGLEAFERVSSDVIETDEVGLAEFDAGDQLHALLQADQPDFVQNQALVNIGSHRRFYIAYGEAYGQPIRVGKVIQDEVKHAYLGGVSFERQANTGLILASLVQRATAQEDRALRFGNLMRYVRPDQPEWLTFVNTRSADFFASLDVSLTFTDGTTSTLTPYPAQNMRVGSKITYAVGPAQLNLFSQLPAGKELQEYAVRIQSGNLNYSASYRYVLNYSFEPYVRHFAYLNSLGAFDTLTTYGKGTKELARFSKQAQPSLAADYSPSDAQYVDFDISLQQQEEVTTGFREAAELARWDDFYRSPLRFRIDGIKALQIGITSKSIKQAKDDDRLFAHKFEFAYLHRDEFYTEAIEPGGDPTPPLDLVVGGTPGIVINTGPQITAVDPTVPAAARQLTLGDLTGLRQTIAAGLHSAAGYIKQATGDMLWFRKDEGIDWLSAIKNKPTNRDEAGLGDVLNVLETQKLTHTTIKNQAGIRMKLKSWSDDVEPV